ncbi:hypothetical protein MJG53_014331 [Ovis ammon polii x Ovis aries]|uniref:Uncharacterized protein n=1 Tax=Ovis ammon polii x Ovis aries TaxID=2918886 RepID=A0ACB9UH74_9CETA|nr:hypothetical protein MJG53_014331 [Ovis ammon polii x Ovis aries]
MGALVSGMDDPLQERWPLYSGLQKDMYQKRQEPQPELSGWGQGSAQTPECPPLTDVGRDNLGDSLCCSSRTPLQMAEPLEIQRPPWGTLNGQLSDNRELGAPTVYSDPLCCAQSRALPSAGSDVLYPGHSTFQHDSSRNPGQRPFVVVLPGPQGLAEAPTSFILSWQKNSTSKCALQDRSEGLVQIVRSADRRVRSRHAKVGALAEREAILQRLDHLEEVVYNQLNGLAKPIGLVEGPGGLGQGGMAATLQDGSQETEGRFEEYGYNAQLSDRISLDRTIPDYRPKKCRQMTYSDDLPQISVVFIFVNEALSVILRSVHSVVNHTPSQLLKEVILVDDNSDNVELKLNLDQYVSKRYPGLVKIVRNSRREGLIRARLQGWKVATAPVVGFFDAHVEFSTGWAEPALTRIREDRRRIVLPAIDNIKYDTFEVQQYASAAHGYNWGLWCMYIVPPQDWLDRGDEAAPIRTPAMIGCSFVVDREYFGDIGLLDPGMEVYGGENIELGMRATGSTGSLIAGLSRNVVLIIVVQEEDGEETTRNGNLIHDEHP